MPPGVIGSDRAGRDGHWGKEVSPRAPGAGGSGFWDFTDEGGLFGCAGFVLGEPAASG